MPTTPIEEIANRDVEIDIPPLKIKAYRLTEESLELLAGDIEKRSALSAKVSASWSVLLALILECFVINQIWDFKEPQKLVMKVILFIVVVACIYFSWQWVSNREKIEDIIKKRCKVDANQP